MTMHCSSNPIVLDPTLALTKRMELGYLLAFVTSLACQPPSGSSCLPSTAGTPLQSPKMQEQGFVLQYHRARAQWLLQELVQIFEADKLLSGHDSLDKKQEEVIKILPNQASQTPRFVPHLWSGPQNVPVIKLVPKRSNPPTSTQRSVRLDVGRMLQVPETGFRAEPPQALVNRKGGQSKSTVLPRTEIVTGPRGEITPELQNGTEPELQNGTEPDLQSITEPELQNRTESVLQNETESELQSITEPELQSSTEPELQSSTEPELHSITEPELQNGTEPELHNGTEPKLHNGTEPKFQNGTKPVSQFGTTTVAMNVLQSAPDNGSRLEPINESSSLHQNGTTAVPRNGTIFELQSGHTFDPRKATTAVPLNGTTNYTIRGAPNDPIRRTMSDPIRGTTRKSQSGHTKAPPSGNTRVTLNRDTDVTPKGKTKYPPSEVPTESFHKASLSPQNKAISLSQSWRRITPSRRSTQSYGSYKKQDLAPSQRSSTTSLAHLGYPFTNQKLSLRSNNFQGDLSLDSSNPTSSTPSGLASEDKIVWEGPRSSVSENWRTTEGPSAPDIALNATGYPHPAKFIAQIMEPIQGELFRELSDICKNSSQNCSNPDLPEPNLVKQKEILTGLGAKVAGILGERGDDLSQVIIPAPIETPEMVRAQIEDEQIKHTDSAEDLDHLFNNDEEDFYDTDVEAKGTQQWQPFNRGYYYPNQLNTYFPIKGYLNGDEFVPDVDY